MVTAPGMIRTDRCGHSSRRHIRTAEIGKREGGYLRGNSQFNRRAVELLHRVTQLLQERCLGRKLHSMGIEPADRAKENLRVRPRAELTLIILATWSN